MTAPVSGSPPGGAAAGGAAAGGEFDEESAGCSLSTRSARPRSRRGNLPLVGRTQQAGSSTPAKRSARHPAPRRRTEIARCFEIQWVCAATRSQYWMLAVMVVFTTLGLWLL